MQVDAKKHVTSCHKSINATVGLRSYHIDCIRGALGASVSDNEGDGGVGGAAALHASIIMHA